MEGEAGSYLEAACELGGLRPSLSAGAAQVVREFVAHMLTEAMVDDATTGVGLSEALDADLARVTADAAYDTIAFHEAATTRGAIVVVPPNKTARVSRRRPRSSARDRTITKMKKIGRSA